jgi:hypothetical protein
MRQFIMPRIKTIAREWEARITPLWRTQVIGHTHFQLTHSICWDETTSVFIQKEIEPYWLALPKREYGVVWDQGKTAEKTGTEPCA